MKKRSVNKICVIDDDPSILEVIKIVLDEANYDVVVISDPENIVKKIKKDLPNLILLDYWVAGYNGQKIAKEIKKEIETKNIPILLISALSNIKEISEEAGVDGFIEKPFDIDDLLKIIKKHLN